ncbi:MAG TPA: response regulator [Hanamia sp.]|nr:response regulator [Hanamia sp.]
MSDPKRKKNNSSKLILIGEDDIDDKEILEEIFLSIDPSIQLHFINSGQKLLSFLENADQEQLPCLIILDYNMPALNGSEILKYLQPMKRLKNIPRIIWSTTNVGSFKSTCMELGASDYFVKPSSLKDLEALIKRMLSYCEVDNNPVESS